MNELELPSWCTQFANCSLNQSARSEYLSLAHMNGSCDDICMNGGIADACGGPDNTRGVTIALVFLLSLIGNTCTIALLSQFKVHKIPDILVIGLALTDLLTTLIPILMSTYAYFAGKSFIQGCFLCIFFGSLAQFTRYSSALIVTLVSLERYFAVNRPFIYRKYATIKRFIVILIICWIAALILAIAPVFGNNTPISSHGGYCLFDLTTPYAIAILIYSGVQYVTVFTCFILVTANLIKVYRRRKKLKVQGEYNSRSRAQDREQGVTFTKPNLTSRISDLGKSIKKAAPIITEKFQLGVEAQFARMLFAVVALFYITWTTIVVVIIIAQIRGSEKDLEEALFWGIRFSIIATAVNPVLYGLLARQYRLAYVYVLRLWFSKCCYCISPPLKDVFSAARNAGGDVYENKSLKNSRYGTQRSIGSQSDWSRNSAGVLLTHTTQIHANIALPPKLQIIQEDISFEPNESSIAAEFSTHVPSAGELSSSVIIPFQARDHNDSSTVDLQVRGALSMHNLVDAGLVELGLSNDPQSGVNNPLAVMTKEIDGVEVVVSPGGSDLDSEGTANDMTKLYSNPMYELTNGTPTRTREEIEEEISRRQNMFAASSSENITLISKKKVTKTRSSDIPYQFTPDYQESPPARHSKVFSLGHVTQQSYKPVETSKEDANLSPLKISRRSSDFLQATDIDTGRPISVPNQKISVTGGNSNNEYESKGVSLSPFNNSEAAQRRQQFSSHSKSLDTTNSSKSKTESKSSRHRSKNSPLTDSSEVQHLKEKFETFVSGPSTSQRRDDANHLMKESSQFQTRTGNQTSLNSAENNSDSGRESMVLEPDNSVAAT